ncbi:MAG: hypothetical protein QGF62_02190 [Gammaproteobacteria bacterium]|nr:hypothetical protein [Gammaproteobacteria bacterium]
MSHGITSNTNRVVMAMLWESWMLTRWGVLARMLIAILTILVFYILVAENVEVITETEEEGLRALFWVTCQLCLFSGIAMGLSQESRPGFPFYLGFWRPVSTRLQVLIPIAYRCLFCMVLYVIPLLLANYLVEIQQLFKSAILLIIPITLMTSASAWWTDKKGLSQLAGWAGVFFGAFALMYYTLHFNQHSFASDPELNWWWTFSFAPLDYLILLLVSLFAVVLTLVGVDRQRHGDEGIRLWQTSDGSGSYPVDANWLADLYQTESPTSSSKRAELWAEINGSGLPAFVWSLVIALSIPMLWLITNLIGSEALWASITVFVLWIPLIGTPNFGIRMKQGRAYLSTFDAARPQNTAWLAGMKIGVGIISMLAGMLVITTSLWFSAPLAENFIAAIGIGRQLLIDFFVTTPIMEIARSLFILFVQFASIVTFMAVLTAIYSIYLDRLTLGILGFMVYLGVLPIIIASETLPLGFAVAHVWAFTAVIAASAIYYCYAIVKNRILGLGYTCVGVFIWLLYALAYFSRLRDDGMLGADIPTEIILFRVAVCVSSLALFALAPWSYAMTRHRR